MSLKKLSEKELAEAVKGALDIVKDPVKYKEFKERTAALMKACGADVLLESMAKNSEELSKRNEEAHKKWAEEYPEQAACDHGVTFDKEAAQKLLDEATHDPDMDPGVAFIMGSPAAGEIRKRWPRLCGQCPKGCGYNGIYYASEEHYFYGDW